MWSSLLDIVFPRRSLTGREGEWITEEECRRLVSFPVREEEGLLRKRGIRSLDRLFAASTYASTPLLRKAIYTLKYGRIREIARDLAELIARFAPPTEVTRPVLCPVPLHWVRRFQRGFNQAELIAGEVGLQRRLSILPLLKRVRPTGTQTLRKREERLTALKAAFRFVGDVIPKNVILIDDLCTTGATLDECANTLKRAGVERVEGWVVARG